MLVVEDAKKGMVNYGFKIAVKTTKDKWIIIIKSSDILSTQSGSYPNFVLYSNQI